MSALLEALLRTGVPNKREILEILGSIPDYTDEHLLHARLRDRRFPFKVNSRLPVPAIARMGKIFELAVSHADPSRRASCYYQLFVMAPDCAGMYLDRAAADRHPIVRRVAAELLSSCHVAAGAYTRSAIALLELPQRAGSRCGDPAADQELSA